MSIYKFKMVNDKEVELTADEIKELEARDVEYAKGELDRRLEAIRELRRPLFIEADWQINKLNDSKGDASKWIAYRIKLRDITKGVDTVNKAKAVTMPEKPK